MDPLEYSTKRCTQCLCEFPLTEEYFYKKSTPRKDGTIRFHAACRACTNAYWKQQYTANKEQIDARHKQYDDTHRDERLLRQRKARAENPEHAKALQQKYRAGNADHRNELARASYHRNRPIILARRQVKADTNRDEMRRKARVRRRNNRDVVNQRGREYHQKHPEIARRSYERRRAKKNGAPYDFTEEDWRYALTYWNQACAVCEAQDGFWHNIAQDHWIALSLPDTPGTVPSNILPLCNKNFGCNQRKGVKDGWTFLIERLGKRKAKAKLKEIEAYFAAVRARGRP